MHQPSSYAWALGRIVIIFWHAQLCQSNFIVAFEFLHVENFMRRKFRRKWLIRKSLVKFRYCEKATKFEKISNYFKFVERQNKIMGHSFKFLWSSQNIWTLFKQGKGYFIKCLTQLWRMQVQNYFLNSGKGRWHTIVHAIA